MARKKKYATEEEKKEAIRANQKKYHASSKGKKTLQKASAKWKEKNKEYISEYNKKYRQENTEFCLESSRKWKEKNPNYTADHWNEYYNTQKGVATYKIKSYKQSDKKANRGECTLTAQWIVDNIFTSKCIYCGEDDWKKLGCDRIDNTKPHTPDNVVCSCGKCNVKRGSKSFEEFLAECKQQNVVI